VPLDGELWLARKAFQRTVSIVRRQDKSDLWREMRFLVFDAPTVTEPFEERMAFLQDLLRSSKPQFALAHQHDRCKDLDHLKQELVRVEGLGGEGLMLRQPGSRYEAGRSFTLLKVKTFHDAEARVVGHLPGAGRHKGRLGALEVELPDGTRFSVGTGFSDAQRQNPPQVGSTISFRYQELSDRGVPRFPSFVRLRGDVPMNPPDESAASPPRERSKGASNSTRRTKAAETMPTAPSSPSRISTTPAGAGAPTKGSARSFEFVDGKSSKFWEISVSGSEVTVRYGRIGTPGQSQTKSFPSEAAAQAHAEKLIAEKTGKGYVET
jgi:DNA ligase-1